MGTMTRVMKGVSRVAARVTAKDVAAAAGVSRATVSYVFNRQSRVVVAPETRERVLRTAAALGYEPNPLARGLAGKSTGVIGVVIGNMDANAVGIDIVRAICRSAAAAHYQVLMCDAGRAPARELAEVRLLVDRAVDGIVFNGPCAVASVEFARDAGVPTLLVERYPVVAGVPGLYVDNLAGSRAAVAHLAGLGHRRLGYVGLTDLHPHDQDRYLGAAEAAREHGMAMLQGWVYRRDDQDARATYGFARALLSEGASQRPTAVYAGGNLFAIEILRAAHDAGLRVPTDLSVISFDDQYAEYTLPRLTTVSASPTEVGEAALRVMLRMLRRKRGDAGEGGALPGPGPGEEIALAARLTVRESTGVAPEPEGAP